MKKTNNLALVAAALVVVASYICMASSQKEKEATMVSLDHKSPKPVQKVQSPSKTTVSAPELEVTFKP